MIERLRWYLTLALLGLLALFGLQNFEWTTFNFLIWSFEAPRFVLILIAVVIGFLAGWLMSLRRR